MSIQGQLQIGGSDERERERSVGSCRMQTLENEQG